METLVANKKWLVDNSLRLDASFYMSDGIKTILVFNKSKNDIKPLSEVTESIFYGGRDKRNYVTNPEAGIPFIKGADITLADFSKLKTISRKRTRNLNSYFLEEEWILVTRSGTVGNTAYVNKDFIGKAASDDIIRIIPKGIKSGYLYAYLTSKYGNALITHGKYGAVIQHIEPEHIAQIPVPIFPQEKQEQIHNLITEAAQLRVEANRLLEEAVEVFEKEMPYLTKEEFISKLNIKEIRQNQYRIDASTNLRNIQDFYKSIRKKYTVKTISGLSKEVFTPNIFKRIRTENKNNGVPYLSGADLMKFKPSFDSYLSKKMNNIDDYILKKGWIAVQDAGTIGYVTLVNGYLNNVSATNNLVRIIPNEENNNPYIFAFLNTRQGQMILKSKEYGSVQKHIDNTTIESLEIPIIDSKFNYISGKVMEYLDKLTEAIFNENQAISLVENEIALWQS